MIKMSFAVFVLETFSCYSFILVILNVLFTEILFVATHK